MECLRQSVPPALDSSHRVRLGSFVPFPSELASWPADSLKDAIVPFGEVWADAVVGVADVVVVEVAVVVDVPRVVGVIGVRRAGNGHPKRRTRTL